MEEIAENLTQDDVLELINDFPILPMRNKLVITVNTDNEDELDLGGHGFAETQYVVATGTTVYDHIKPGCKVLLDLGRMSMKERDPSTGEPVFTIQIKPIKVNNKVFAIINDGFVDAVDNR